MSSHRRLGQGRMHETRNCGDLTKRDVEFGCGYDTRIRVADFVGPSEYEKGEAVRMPGFSVPPETRALDIAMARKYALITVMDSTSIDAVETRYNDTHAR